MREGSRHLIRGMVRTALWGLAGAAAVWTAALAVLACLGIKSYIVMSGSMEPAVSTGSLCLVDTRASFSEVRGGEVIAFETAGGMLVVHRAVRVGTDRIETRGDANPVPDGPAVTADNFRGILLFSIPHLGYLYHAMGTGPGKALCAALILAVLTLKIPRKQAKR